MASASRSITLTAPAGVTYTLTASFVENSTSTTNNTSSVTCTARIASSNASWSSSYNSTLIIYWHDNRENYDRQVSSVAFSSLGAGASKTASGTITVTHNNDGNLSGYAYAKFTKGGTSSYTPASNGVTTAWTALTKINRGATTNSVSGSDIEGQFSVKYTTYVSGYTYKLRVSIPNVVELEKFDYNTSNTSFTLTQETIDYLYNYTKNSGNTVSLGFAVETWNSAGTSIVNRGNEVIITGKILNAEPTFTASYLDTNNTTVSITQNNQQLIRNASTLQVNLSDITALKEATIATIKVIIDGTTYNGTVSGSTCSIDVGILNLSSNVTANVTVTDSRNLSTTHQLTLQILDWQLPTGIISLERQSNFYSETDINVDADYSSLDNKNQITIKARYKKVEDSTYSAYVTLQNNVTSVLTLDNLYSWDVQVLVQDLIGSTTYNLSVGIGLPILYIDRLKRSVGVDCFPNDTESLEVKGVNVLDGMSKKVVDYTVDTATNKLEFDLPNSKPTDIYEMYLLGTVNTTANQDISIQFNGITSGYYTCMMLQHTSGTADGNLTGSNLFRANKGQFYNGSSLGHTVSAMKYEFFVSNNRILCNWDVNIFGDGSALKGVGKSSGYINSTQTQINKVSIQSTTTTSTKLAVGTRILIIRK